MNINRIKNIIIFYICKLPLSGYLRGKILSLASVKISKHVFIGENVTFDTVYPDQIEVGEWTTLARGVTILTHYIDMDKPIPGFSFNKGKVQIGKACFIGTNTIICNSVSIGDNAIIGAGSVVTHDIPANEVWAGVPAKFIKKRIVLN